MTKAENGPIDKNEIDVSIKFKDGWYIVYISTCPLRSFETKEDAKKYFEHVVECVYQTMRRNNGLDESSVFVFRQSRSNRLDKG